MSESIWKKEISFGRKKAKASEEVATETEAPAAAEPKQSFLKKEISFGRKKPKADAAAPQVEVVPPPAAQLELPPPEEYGWLTASLEEISEAPAPAAQPPVRASGPVEGARGNREVPPAELATPVPTAPVVPVAPPPPPPPAAVAPAPPVAPPPAPVAPAVPTVPTAMPAVSFTPPAAPVTPPVAPPPVPPVAPAPAVSVPATPPVASPPPAPAAPPLSAPPMPTVQFTPPPPPPAPSAAPPAPVAPVVTPPLTDLLQLEPEEEEKPEPEAKTPFWKKEIGRKKKDKQPKEKKERAPRKKKDKEPKAEKAPKDKSDKTPFWKLELSRKPKDGGDGPKPAKAPKASKPPKQASLAKQTVVGLKIGASQIAAARVQNNGSPQLLQVARESLQDGIVVGGELRDFESLAEQLKEFFTKHKLPRKGVRLGIANNRIGVRTFEISGIDDPRQLANAIRFRAQETLPIPLEEAVLDWQVLSESIDPESGQLVRRVLLVVAYRELVDRYVDACKRAGIKLAGIDLEAFAMLRALTEPVPADAPPSTGAQVVVNVGHDRSTFAVSDGRVCEFTRVLGWGGSALSVAVARQLDCTPSEAEPVKHALSLVAETEPPEGVTVETMGVAREAVRRELQAFARELVSSLRFYQNQPGSLGIGELVVTGGTAHLPGFAEELERLIGVPVKVGDPLVRVKLPKKLKMPDRVGSLAVAIGLGIED